MLTALIFAVVASTSATPAPKPLPTNSAECLHYYHQACSEAIGKWLPEMNEWYSFKNSAGFEFVDPKAIHVSFTDGFVYEGEWPKLFYKPYLDRGSVWPRDGTFFVYGNAGPPKGSLVYDYARQIAFYNQRCCSWMEVIAAKGVSSPPKPVVSRNLGSLHTFRGVALGQSVEEVQRLYGHATAEVARNHPAIRRLSYVHVFDRSCGQWQTFIFKNNRLIYIALYNGC